MLGFTNTTNVTLVLSQSAEGLEPEELENFGKAWAEALSLFLERRRMAGGIHWRRSWRDWQRRWGWTSSVK